MRFALCFIFGLSAIIGVAAAKPGDVYDAEHVFPKTNTRRVSTGTVGHLKTIPGYSVTLLERQLPRSAAMASSKHDIYVLGTEDGTLTKLRDRHGDGRFEAKAPYLIGFDKPSDLIIAGDHIFVSDRQGLWRMEIEPSLSATKSPILYKPLKSHASAKKARHLAFHAGSNTLYLTDQPGLEGTEVYAIDVRTKRQVSKTTYPFNISNLTVSPSGTVFAVQQVGFNSDIVALRGSNTTQLEHSKNPNFKRMFRGDMAFYANDSDNDEYPDEWDGTLITAVSVASPMIAFIPFEYGELSDSMTSIVEGFTGRSARIGYQNVYTYPTAITVMGNGRIVFLDSKGSLWAIDKAAPPKPKPAAVEPKANTPMVKPDPFRSNREAIIKGENKVQNKKSPPEQTSGDKDYDPGGGGR